jgi:hypothetical protein
MWRARKRKKASGARTPPPHSLLREALPSLDDLFHKRAGFTVGVPRPKWTRTETGSSTGSPWLPHMVMVFCDSWVTSVVLALREQTHLFRVLQVPSSSLATGVATKHDGDVVHVESQGSGAPAQEGQPLIFPVGVLLVCV